MTIQAQHHRRTAQLKTSALLAATLAVTAALAGCSGGALPKDFGVGVTPTTTARYTGSVYGGQQPVVGSSIQLYGVSTTFKGTSTPLISASTPVVTDGNGNFSITGRYNCTGISDVYVVATGGNPGFGGNNSAVNLAAALGDCTTLQLNAANIFINIDEISTVAAAYALAPFATDYTHIGSSNATALTNAFASVNELVSLGSGFSPGVNLPAGETVPVTTVNTLGNILAACVNSTGPGSSTCSTLFAATGAVDTFGAALAIARNPGAPAVTGLYTLPSSTAPFQPSLAPATQPNDFTLAVSYTGSNGLSAPFGIALDARGNAWVTNEGGSAVVEFSSNGAVVATPTTTGLYGAQGVAVDRTGNVWVANTAGNSVVKFTLTAGAVTATSSFTAGGITAPTAIALDSASNAFVTNFNANSVTELTSAGAAANGSPFTVGGAITVPSGIAVDSTGSVLVTSGTGSVVKLTNAGVLSATLNDGTLQGPLAVAVDASNNVFASGSTTGTAVAGAVAEFSAAAAPSPASPVSGGTATPFGLASDGIYAYIANSVSSGSLAKLQYGNSTSISPANGYGFGASLLNTPTGVAVDASGNVWTTNTGSNTVSKFIGLANPITTPVAANVGP